MNSDTQAITIGVGAASVFEFVSNPENLPKWAGGYFKGVYRDQDGWALETDLGRMALDVQADARTGLVDFHIQPPIPIKITASCKVTAAGSSSHLTFTHYQIPFLPPKYFERQKQEIAKSLSVLKQLMEQNDGSE